MIIKKIVLVILAASLSLTIFFVVTNKKYKKIFKVDYLKNGIDLKIDNAFIVQDTGNKKEWELSTESAKVFREEEVTILTNVNMNIYPDENDIFNISAKTGKIKNKEKDLEVSGDVVASNKDFTLTTQSLKWISSKKEINTDKHVTIKGTHFTASGVGLTIDMDSKTLRIKNKVTAVFEMNNDA